jgi:hypothetical protein
MAKYQIYTGDGAEITGSFPSQFALSFKNVTFDSSIQQVGDKQ